MRLPSSRQVVPMKDLLLRRFREIRSDTKGVTAIEFAAVGPVFFGLLLTIIETGIVFAANQMLENAVYNGSRQILTGELQTFQSNGGSATDTYCKLVKSICGGMSAILNQASCYSNIQLDVKTHARGTGFTATDLKIPVDASGALDASQLDRGSYGGPGDYMLIRGYYQYPVYTAYIGGGVGATDSGKRLLVGTAALVIEPFPGSAAPSSNKSALTSVSCS